MAHVKSACRVGKPHGVCEILAATRTARLVGETPGNYPSWWQFESMQPDGTSTSLNNQLRILYERM